MKIAVSFVHASALALFLFTACDSPRSAGSLPGTLPTLTSAAHRYEYYLSGTREQRKALRDLFSLLETAGEDSQMRFCIVREIAEQLKNSREHQKLVNLLNAQVQLYPDDPFNAWYLLMVAWIQLENGAAPVAVLYFDRIVKNHADLTVGGKSVHLASLEQLIKLLEDPWRRVACYRELIERFPDDTDQGQAWFALARAYEDLGDWDLALQTYAKFLAFPDTVVPGTPNAFAYAKLLIDFNNSPKDWSFERLDDLVKELTDAIQKGNIRALSRLMAKVNFNALSWGQDPDDLSGRKELNFSDLMTGTRIRYAEGLDPDSNAKEAWLRTWGWSQQVSVWYLYFRKIYFPASPEIHGRWEWAGIYYGEKN